VKNHHLHQELMATNRLGYLISLDLMALLVIDNFARRPELIKILLVEISKTSPIEL
jgi:hypothetical protein